MPREPIVFQEAIDAIEDSLQRLRRVEKQLALVVPERSMAPVVKLPGHARRFVSRRRDLCR